MADLSTREVAERMLADGKTEAVIQISGREMWVVVNPKYEEFDTFQSFYIEGVKIALGLKKPAP
jgi:hypothetical protein